MRKQTSQVFVAIVCAILGFLLAYQFKVLTTKGGGIPTVNADVIDEIEALRKEKEEVSNKNNELLEEIKALEESVAENGKIDSEMKKSLDKARMQLGTVDVKGEGITITIKPNSSIFGNPNDTSVDLGENEIVHLVNTLWYSKAEAIAVNDYRVTTQTGIKNSGNIVWIGTSGKKVSPKDTIVISAIGDKAKLQAAIKFPGVLEMGALSNYTITIAASDDILIEKTTETYKTDFISPVTEKKEE